MSVFRVGDGQRGRRRVPVAPVDGRTGAIDVESQPEHGVRLVELDVFRQNGAFFPAMRTPKCKSSEKYGLCGKRSLKSSSTALFNVPCAYGGLLSGTFHVLISFQGFELALVIMRSAKI